MGYVILLILIIFVISCDNQWVKELKKKITGSCDDEEVDTTDITTKGVAETAEKVVETAVESEDAVEKNVNHQRIEGFNTDTNINTDYQTYIENSNIDPEIIESHRDYTEDSAYLASTGASQASVRDDFMPAVPFHGLPRTAHYKNLGAEMGARTGQSETPETVIDIAHHNDFRYSL